MHSDVLIHALRIQVDPADSTYMPAVVLINVGDSMSTLRELTTITLLATDEIVTLFSNARVRKKVLKTQYIEMFSNAIKLQLLLFFHVDLRTIGLSPLHRDLREAVSQWRDRLQGPRAPGCGQEALRRGGLHVPGLISGV